MGQVIRDGARYPVVVGGTFTADVPAGSILHVQEASAATAETVTADADGATTEALTAVGRYYLGWQKSSTDPICPAGVIDVVSLVDADEESLVAMLEGVKTKITAAESSLVQFQISDPSGTAATRMNLAQMHRLRRSLENQLADLRRKKSGALPVRLS